MTRKRRLGLTGIAGILAMLLGSGLIAVVSDSVTSEGNTAESGAYIPPFHDLKAARVSVFDSCDGATYGDGPFTAAIQTQLDISNSNSHYQEDTFCLKNRDVADAAPGKLTASFTAVTDTEVGPCAASEADQGGDTTCEDGAAGELKPLVYVQWLSCSGGGSCAWGPSNWFSAYESAPVVLDASFVPGETYQARLSVYTPLNFNGPPERLRAQTDRLQWNIVFTLEDA